MQIPDPQYMTLKDWADAAMYSLSHYDLVSDLRDNDWQAWGMAFMNNQRLSTLNLPDPYQYTDWQEWARRLSEAMGPADGVLFNNMAGSTATAAFIIAQDGSFLTAQDGSFLVTQ